MPKPMRRRDARPKEKPEFEQHILDLRRVTRVTKGGKQLSFRACVILGDRRGRVGLGMAKGADVQLAVEKAAHQARKHIMKVPILKDTLPHPVQTKFKAAKVMLKPAPPGSGIIAGGAVRSVLELAGVPNVSSKILGKTKNKVTIAEAALQALRQFKPEIAAKAMVGKESGPVLPPPAEEVKQAPVVVSGRAAKIKEEVERQEKR